MKVISIAALMLLGLLSESSAHKVVVKDEYDAEPNNDEFVDEDLEKAKGKDKKPAKKTVKAKANSKVKMSKAMKKMAKGASASKKPAAKGKATSGTSSKDKCAEPYKQVSTEFDKDFNSEKGKNGYGKADESNIYNQFEDKECGTPLDGQALSKEIGGT